MKLNLLTFIILSFAAFRLTRFLIIDTFFEGTRARFHTYLANKQGKLKFLWEKIYDLSSCTWCLGFWTSLILYSFYMWICPIYFGRVDLINVFAIAGIQGLLHAWEPDNE